MFTVFSLFGLRRSKKLTFFNIDAPYISASFIKKTKCKITKKDFLCKAKLILYLFWKILKYLRGQERDILKNIFSKISRLRVCVSYLPKFVKEIYPFDSANI